MTAHDDYYLVDVALARDFPTGIPIHSIRAKVSPANGNGEAGSSTEYRRDFQMSHQEIDKVVVDCQQESAFRRVPDKSRELGHER